MKLVKKEGKFCNLQSKDLDEQGDPEAKTQAVQPLRRLTLDLGITLTATSCPFSSPFLAVAEEVYPKWPRPTSSPSSYLAKKFFENPKLLSKPSSASDPSGIEAPFGFTEPWRRARRALMCFAGEGGGKGRLKIRSGVEPWPELAGEPLRELHRGLGL